MEKVLIVDDDAMVAKTLTFVCECAGLEVVGWAWDIEGALELFAASMPKLVLLDVQLQKEESGLEFAAAIRLMGHNPKMVLVTGQTGEVVSRMIQFMGLDGFIEKGANLHLASDTLRNVLSGQVAWTSRSSPFSPLDWESKLDRSMLEILVSYGKFRSDEEGAELLDIEPSTFRKRRNETENRLKMRGLKLSQFCSERGFKFVPDGIFSNN